MLILSMLKNIFERSKEFFNTFRMSAKGVLMKLMHFRNMMFSIALLFSVTLVAYDVEGLTYIECELRLRERGHRYEYQDFEFTEEHSSTDATFTHPHIPVKEGTSQNWSGYAAVTNLKYP